MAFVVELIFDLRDISWTYLWSVEPRVTLRYTSDVTNGATEDRNWMVSTGIGINPEVWGRDPPDFEMVGRGVSIEYFYII